MNERPLVRKLRAFKELVSKSHSAQDIAATLISDGALDKEVLHTMSTSYDPAETLFKHIEMAHSSGKIQLLSYSWQLLPTQIISITVVTPHKKREFQHEEL